MAPILSLAQEHSSASCRSKWTVQDIIKQYATISQLLKSTLQGEGGRGLALKARKARVSQYIYIDIYIYMYVYMYTYMYVYMYSIYIFGIFSQISYICASFSVCMYSSIFVAKYFFIEQG